MAVVTSLRVAHVIHWLSPGGAERVLLDLAHVAPQAGLELAVLPLVEAADDRYRQALRGSGVRVAGLNLCSRWDPRAFSRAIAELRDWRADVVHTHLKHADTVGAVAARRLGIPMVSTLHMIEDAQHPMLRFKRRVAATARMSTAARTISVSDAQRRWYLGAFPQIDAERVVTIHNGVSDPRGGRSASMSAERMRASLGVPPGAVLAVIVGILRPGKGHADLFAALRLVHPGLDLHLVVVGDGELRPTLEGLAEDQRNRIHFVGFRDDVAAILASSDLLVQPSEFDALPTAVMQALAVGLPVVGTAVGGIPEIVTPREGVLVPPQDPPALAAALTSLAADPARRERMAASGRRRFEERFDAVGWAARLRDLYVAVSEESR